MNGALTQGGKSRLCTTKSPSSSFTLQLPPATLTFHRYRVQEEKEGEREGGGKISLHALMMVLLPPPLSPVDCSQPGGTFICRRAPGEKGGEGEGRMAQKEG